MRHRVYGNKLGRNKNERTALFKSLVQSLLTHGTIITSKIKAKAIKGQVDKLFNLAKNKNTHHLLRAFLSEESLADRLIKEITPKLADRTCGYTSVVKLGNRYGDNTMMVRMSIIGAEELEPIKKETRVKSQESNEKPKKELKTEVKKPEVKKGKKSSS